MSEVFKTNYDSAERSVVARRLESLMGTRVSVHCDSSVLIDNEDMEKESYVMYPKGNVEKFSNRGNHMGDTLAQLQVLEEGSGGFGRVLDFGSGVRRRYCDRFNMVSHVDLHQRNGKCECGAENRTFFDCMVADYDTFLAVNSMQNNSERDQRKMFGDLKLGMKRVVIVQPKKLNSDEWDVRAAFLETFAYGTVSEYLYGTVFFYDPVWEDTKPREIAGNVDEVDVNRFGEPRGRKEENLRSVVLMGVEDRHPIVVRHADGRAVDFLVAGHIKYGETPMQALLREASEEMIDPIEGIEFVGVIVPLYTEWEVFVYYTKRVRREDGSFVRPERSRGYAVKMEYGMFPRNMMPRSIMLCVNAGIVDFDADKLHVAYLKKKEENKKRWALLDKERLSEYFSVHQNMGQPVVHLAHGVASGDMIKVEGPRIAVHKPPLVSLYSAGRQVGTARRMNDGLYEANVSGDVSRVRVWCNSKVEPIIMPVTEQCANVLSGILTWNSEEIFNYLVSQGGEICLSDMISKGCRVQGDCVEINYDRGKEYPATEKMKFQLDPTAVGGEKKLNQVRKETKKEKVRKRKLNNFV